MAVQRTPAVRRAYRPSRWQLSSKPSPPRKGLKFRWATAISTEEWETYKRGMEAIRKAGIPFMLGGGFALASFTGRWRDTKDIDLYINPQDRGRAVAALDAAGFSDYFERLPYDRKWIYRSVRADVIVDVIWSMANQRAQVDDLWFRRSGSLRIRGQKLRVLPPEEFIWCKLYILQRDHCDWTDVFNLLYAIGPEIDWDHLLGRLEDDWPLLKALLTVYGWLCPASARELPHSLWRQLQMQPPVRKPGIPPAQRIRWLDSRAWFAALQPPHKKLEV